MATSLDDGRTPFLTRLVEIFLRGDVAILLTVVSLMLGAAALLLTPREEEPQIVVPLADVHVRAPGLSAAEVERQVTDRLEKLLYQIDGVEFVYSMSQPGRCVVTVRFYVGEDREDSLVKIYNKIESSTDLVPPGVESWVVKPVEVDDVPIVIATLWSERPEYGDHALRRIAGQIQHDLQAIHRTNRVQIVGGRPRRIRVLLDAQRLAAHSTSPLQIAAALRAGNVNHHSGAFQQQDRHFLVDDPITDVENIARYFAMKLLPPRESVLRAVQEVRPALLLSTLAIIISFLPLAFITGMMGPYMAPMALNVPLTVTVSTVVAFLITPWLAMVALRKVSGAGVAAEGEQFDLSKRPLYRVSRAILTPMLSRRLYAWCVLGAVMLLLIAALTLPLFRLVPVKILPYDNKNEFQVVIDMPEGTTLERTDVVARRIGRFLGGVSEVRDYELFVGLASPMDFNGLVRHYFLRQGPHVAEIRVNLLAKEHRVQQSHAILLRIRDDLTGLADSLGARVKLVESPPGPPVLSTITAEVYGPAEGAYRQQIAVARLVERRLAAEPGVVDLDVSAEDDQVRYVFEADKPKAALSGISTEAIAPTVAVALDGHKATVMHLPEEVEPLWVELRLPRASRSAIDDLQEVYVQGQGGAVVQLGALGRFRQTLEDKTIYHKNLRRVVFVYAEVAGRPPADAIADIQRDQAGGPSKLGQGPPRPLQERSWLSPGGGAPWSIPAGYSVDWAGEGELNITLDVFRDLGLSFAAALLGIFVILMFQTGSRTLPLLIMLAIPLTLIGIMPGFWILNLIMNKPVGGHPNPVFFTATAMIGMIALAGIVVRNSVVLIDFIHMAVAEGHSLRESIIRSVAVRTRPIMLTAGTTLLANWVITLDPVFSGLAWAVIFGMFTSTMFTLVVIPAAFWLLYEEQ